MWPPAVRRAELFKWPGLPAAWSLSLLNTWVFSLVFISCWCAGWGAGNGGGGQGRRGELRTRNALHMHCAFCHSFVYFILQCVSLFPVFFPSFFCNPCALCALLCCLFCLLCRSTNKAAGFISLELLFFFWLMPLTVFCFHLAWGSTQRLENVILLLITAITDSEQDWDTEVSESGGRGV